MSEDPHKGELFVLYLLWEASGSENKKGSRGAFPTYETIYVHIALVIPQDSSTWHKMVIQIVWE